MYRNIGLLLLFGGALGVLLSYIYRDLLVLDKTSFAFWIATLRIGSFALLTFLTVSIFSLGSRLVPKRLYILALLLIPALIPDLFHILSFVFFPDFITKNTRDKVAYLFLLSRSFLLLAFFISVFYRESFFKERLLTLACKLLSLLSLVLSLGIVFFYHKLPKLFVEGYGTPWHRDFFEYFSSALMLYLAYRAGKYNLMGEKASWLMVSAFGLLALSSISLALYENFFDFQIVLSSAYRLAAYSLIVFSVLYLFVREENLGVIDASRDILIALIRTKPSWEEGVIYMPLRINTSYVSSMYLYELDSYRLIAQVYFDEKEEPPKLDIRYKAKLAKELVGQFFDRDYHYLIQENYLLVTRLRTGNLENPLVKLHILNLARLVLGYLLNWIYFDRIVNEKSRELQRLYLLLETSEYATQAYNNIDTFSKQVLERLDQTLHMDGSLFYIWNKNADLPERVVFSTNFLKNFPEENIYKYAHELIEDRDTYGIRGRSMFCKFESSSYQAGVIGFRKEKDFDKEELLFLKTVSNQLFHVIRLMKIIEDLEKAQESVKFLSEYDPLTMLYNRRTFEEALAEEIDRADRFGEQLCILFIDVDNFKVINDTYGHHIGDMVLKSVAQRLKNSIRHLDTAGRLGGDEFGVIAPKVGKNLALYIAERLKRSVEDNPVNLGEYRIPVSVSVGAICYPEDTGSKEDILFLGEALILMAKREGKGKIKLLEQEVKEFYSSIRKLEKDIMEAIDKRNVEVHLQEIVDLASGELLAFEALMRLRVNDEIIPPYMFIELAEEFGVIKKLDLALIEKLMSLLRHPDSSFCAFINLSPLDIDESFVRDVRAIVGSFGIDPSRIVFELTERKAIEDMNRVINFVKELKNAGFRFAIDDFGSGYSSFLYLKYIPVDFLKIEGEFIKSIKRSEVDRAFVKSMVEIAKTLNIKTIAEFVEDVEIVDMLMKIGVDYAQGYYIGKPEPAEEKLRRFFSRGESQEPEGKHSQ